jgi:hypothetical protein
MSRLRLALVLVVGVVGIVEAGVEVVLEGVSSAHDEADREPRETGAGHEKEAQIGHAFVQKRGYGRGDPTHRRDVL